MEREPMQQEPARPSPDQTPRRPATVVPQYPQVSQLQRRPSNPIKRIWKHLRIQYGDAVTFGGAVFVLVLAYVLTRRVFWEYIGLLPAR